MLLQAYDFQHLFEHHNVTMQAGGSDQYGNITAGVELIRRRLGQKAYGMVYPLITKADGTKFGKTESGTIWLSPERTSPYRFYQFWFNADDADVGNFLRVFTWLKQDEIADLEHQVETAAHERAAQRKLAQEVTRMIHGETAVSKAEKAAQVLFGGDLDGLDASDIQDIFADVPSSEFAKDQLDGEGVTAVDLLVSSGLASSKGDARRSVQGGGIYINSNRVEDSNQAVTTSDAVEGQFLVLRKGRKKYHLIQIK
jgi:tyrosyl-tRNA synthetase